MSLTPLYLALAEAFDGPEAIEAQAAEALRAAAGAAAGAHVEPRDLQQPFREVLAAPEAHPVCVLIAATPLPWAPPETSKDALYVAHSTPKMQVELLGPHGLVYSDEVRLGLYGILPGAEYGIRTHPAEEVFVMLAGEADWARDGGDYAPLGPGDRSYHPSMMRHATRTRAQAFMSLYAWRGDVSTDNYVYHGLRDG